MPFMRAPNCATGPRDEVLPNLHRSWSGNGGQSLRAAAPTRNTGRGAPTAGRSARRRRRRHAPAEWRLPTTGPSSLLGPMVMSCSYQTPDLHATSRTGQLTIAGGRVHRCHRLTPDRHDVDLGVARCTRSGSGGRWLKQPAAPPRQSWRALKPSGTRRTSVETPKRWTGCSQTIAWSSCRVCGPDEGRLPRDVHDGPDEVRSIRNVRNDVSRSTTRRRTLIRGRVMADRRVEDDWRFTKVYVRRAGRWQVVSFHASNTAS